MATRAVWVLRHAKAAAHGPDDHARPLTARGRRQAHEVGRYLRDAVFDDIETPRTVLCSSATRARQTAEIAAEGLGGDVELVVEPALYGADADDVVDVLRIVDDAASSVLVVGHNPTFHELAVLLVSDDREDERARMEQRFPTAALAVVAVPAPSWDRLMLGTGRLVTLHFPDA